MATLCRLFGQTELLRETISIHWPTRGGIPILALLPIAVEPICENQIHV